jgi:hypothetical protein
MNPYMERRAFVVALALTLPLVLYGIPLAYAASSSSYVVRVQTFVPDPSTSSTLYSHATARCNGLDYATGGGVTAGGYPPGGYQPDPNQQVLRSSPAVTANEPQTGDQPNSWVGSIFISGSWHFGMVWEVYVVCQTPIAVGGIGVPEFGSLYVAIALGAVVYFMLSRRLARRPSTSVQSQGVARYG